MDATSLARTAVARLVGHGIREAVLAPGSRNAPIAFALADAADAGALRLHTRIDERSAAFLALGLTKVGAPALVTCTSGTAVANLHPALVEAAHAGLPMVALTADRPRRLRGTSANQTTDQDGAFGPLVPTVDIEDADGLATAGLPSDLPAHWNLRLDDPLVPPPGSDGWADSIGSRTDRWVEESPAPTVLTDVPRTVVIAGDDAGPPARTLAEAGGWPLFAEPSGGARTGTHALRTYRLLLDSDLAGSIKRVVCFGRPTLSRPVQRLLARSDVEVLWVGHRGVWSEPIHEATRVDQPMLADTYRPDSAWFEAWQEADRRACAGVDSVLRSSGFGPHVVASAVWQALPAGGTLVVGASNPIRDLDLVASPATVGERRKVIANRGLSGIDGVVSTAIGAALGRPHATRNLALVGDLTFLHDSNGLILGPEEPRPDLTIVVVNDDGGSIFATLEQGAQEYAGRFERLFGTPHGTDLAQLCAASRIPHLAVSSEPELRAVLDSPNGGIEVIEARVDRSGRRELEEQLRAVVTRESS